MSRISDWNPNRESFDQMRESLRGGVKAVSVPQLFPTPPALAERVVAAAGIEPGDRVLEPSAGTGALLAAIFAADPSALVDAVELNGDLATMLRRRYPDLAVWNRDFLTWSPARERPYDRIVMNPPFAKQQDIRHVAHAMKFLKPGGRLVASMSAGIAFRDDKLTREFQDLVNAHSGTVAEIEDDAFKATGMGVRTVLVTMEG